MESDAIVLLAGTLKKNEDLERRLDRALTDTRMWINKNNNLWNAMGKLPGGLEMARSTISNISSNAIANTGEKS